MKALAVIVSMLLLSSSWSMEGEGKDGKDHDDDDGKRMSHSGSHVEASGKSGKLRLWREEDAASGNSSKPRRTPPIFISFDVIDEKKRDGNAIDTKKGGEKHHYKDFRDLEFTVSDIKNATLPYTSDTVDCQYIELTATLKDRTSTLKLMVHMASEDGIVTIDGEQTEVKSGNVKFSLELSDWEWCKDDACQGEVGEFLDVGIVVGIPPTRKAKGEDKTASRGRKFDLDKNSFISFSSKVYLDGYQWVDMAADYPKLDESDPKKTMFIVRIPHFNTTALYDPLAESGTEYLTEDQQPDPDTYDPSGGDTSSATIVVAFPLLTTALMAIVSLLLHS